MSVNVMENVRFVFNRFLIKTKAEAIRVLLKLCHKFLYCLASQDPNKLRFFKVHLQT